MLIKASFIVLSILVMISAVSVVYSRHEGRKLFVELQKQQELRDSMNIEWGKLQIEQSTWATHSRVASKAITKLGMVVPKIEDVRIIKK